MMTGLFTQDDQSLEFGGGTKKEKEVVCPECKLARLVSVNWIGGICCNKYFSLGTMLPLEKAEGVKNINKPVNKEFTGQKADAEKRAYDWKDKMEAEGKLGTRSHEPDGKERNW